MKDRILIILIIMSIILTSILGFKVKASEEGILFDKAIMEYIHSNTTLVGVKIMKIVTYFGSVYFLLPISFILLILMFKTKNRKGIILLLLSTLGVYGLNFLVKNIFMRTRPLEYFLIEEKGYSFPSGHSMISMSFYTAMTYLILKSISNSNIKIILWILNFLIIGAIGFSRIYLGVHWPTDVLTGFMLGLLLTYVWIKLVEKTEK